MHSLTERVCITITKKTTDCNKLIIWVSFLRTCKCTSFQKQTKTGTWSRNSDDNGGTEPEPEAKTSWETALGFLPVSWLLRLGRALIAVTLITLAAEYVLPHFSCFPGLDICLSILHSLQLQLTVMSQLIKYSRPLVYSGPRIGMGSTIQWLLRCTIMTRNNIFDLTNIGHVFGDQGRYLDIYTTSTLENLIKKFYILTKSYGIHK